MSGSDRELGDLIEEDEDEDETAKPLESKTVAALPGQAEAPIQTHPQTLATADQTATTAGQNAAATDQLAQKETPALVSTRGPIKTTTDAKQSKASAGKSGSDDKAKSNLVIKLLEKNPLGMTLPEMAGGPRKQKRIKILRPMLTEAIKEGLVMPISQRAGHTVYKLVKHMGAR